MSEILMTFQTLKQYKSFPSNDYFMLSELIDNSISSYIKNSKLKTAKGLVIEIIVTRNSGSDSNSVMVTDNAFGMDEEKLSKSLKMGDQTDEKDSDLNVYGIGLKQAAFYLGKKLSIFTKMAKMPIFETSIDIDEISKSLDKVVRYEIIKPNNKNIMIHGKIYENGTCVTIDKLWKGRLTENRCTEMKFNLGMKYARYINEGLKLNLMFKMSNNETNFEILSKKPVCENSSEFIKNAISEKKVREGVTRDIFFNKIKSKFEKQLANNNFFAKDFCEKIEKKEPFIWKFEEEVISNIRIKGEIGILAHHRTASDFDEIENQTYVKYNGFTIYQANRAILCAPNSDSLKSYNVISKDISGGNNHKRRWFGWIEIDDLYNAKDENNDRKFVDLNTNKSNLDWIDMIAKNNFNRILLEKMDQYDYLLENYQLIQNDILKLENKSSKKIKLNENEEYNDKFIQLTNLSKNNMSVNCSVYLNNDIENKLNISLILVDDFSTSNTLVLFRESNNYTDFEIKLNVKHRLWKPMVDDDLNDEIIIEFRKLGIVIALSEIFMDLIQKDKKIINKNLNFFIEILALNKKKKMRISEVISYFANRICVEDKNDEN